jgi:hypothetical protein
MHCWSTDHTQIPNGCLKHTVRTEILNTIGERYYETGNHRHDRRCHDNPSRRHRRGGAIAPSAARKASRVPSAPS